MIDNKQMRVGNWVMYKGKPHKWQENDFIDKEIRVNGQYIALSPAILEGCGFKAAYSSFHDNVHIMNLKMDGFELQYHSEVQDGIIVSAPQSDDGHVAHCPYLHNLQNLFFVLQGQELNYNPHGK